MAKSFCGNLFILLIEIENLQLYNKIKHTIVGLKERDKMKRLPDAEFSVMKAIWNCEQPVSTAEIKDCLSYEKDWNMSALQTVLSRLEEKGFVKSEKNGRNRFYTAVVAQEDYVLDESRDFARRMSGQSLPELVAAMFGGRKISDAEADELMKFIESRREG